MLEIWIINLLHSLSVQQYQDLYSEIDADKQKRLKKFHFLPDAQRSLIGDIAIRLLIYKHFDMFGTKLDFKKNEYGKPYLDGRKDIQFNLSHAGDYVACAISNHSVGIDIEIIKPIDLDVAKKMFTYNEYNYILSAKESKQQYLRFYYIWTKKEAYVKYKGKGLQIPLRSFDVLKLQDEVCYQHIFQNMEFICHACQEKKELPITYFLSAQKVADIYLARKRTCIGRLTPN